MEFSREEIRAVLSLGLVAGFIVSFSELFVLKDGHLLITSDGIIIFLLACFGMVVSVWIHEASHKLFARLLRDLASELPVRDVRRRVRHTAVLLRQGHQETALDSFFIYSVRTR